MKKGTLFYVVIFSVLFALFGCSCNKDEIISQEKATSVLKGSLSQDNVEIITTTNTLINGIKSSSTQKDIYYQNKYYHSSENSDILTRTWYGYINDVLYAFYYTKSTDGTETKTSSRIEQSQLDSAKNQLNSIISNLFDENGNLLANHEINGKLTEKTYTIQITNSTDTENIIYTISITDGKITKIINTSNITNNSITTTYDYNYNVNDIELPSLSEYPLNVNG